MIKIEFPPEMSRDDEVEILFAEPVEGGFRLENSPFYVYGVSYLDVVAADAGSDRWLFTHIKKRSGHSTYRILLNGKHQEAEFKTRWPELETLGCTYEEGGKPEHRLYAIDIPPDADVHEAYR